jgi:predicted transcriptional regulator
MAARRPHGDLEAAVLRAVWAAGEPVSPGQVRQAVGEGYAYTTVLTVLTRLFDKGLLARERAGRSYRYRAVLEESEVTGDQMGARLHLAHDQEAVLSRFVAGLSPAEMDILRQLLAPGSGT